MIHWNKEPPTDRHRCVVLYRAKKGMACLAKERNSGDSSIFPKAI